MKRLKAVLIGCGNIARAHLDALGDLKNVEVAAVCDISPAKAEATAERFGIERWYTSYSEMLADIHPDLVHITTPPAVHFPIAKDCLAAGLNVFCEKPIVVNYGDFSELKRLADANRCMLMENQNLRFHPSIQRINGLIKQGDFGDVLDVQLTILLNIVGRDSPYVDRNVPHFGLALRGGVIGDFLPHIAYLAYPFTGPPLEVRTIWEKRRADSVLPADEFRGMIKGQRATAYVTFSGNAQPEAYWLRLSGTKMYVETNLAESRRFTARRLRPGEPALTKLVEGTLESRDLLKDSIMSFWGKFGARNYALLEILARSYHALEANEPQPIALDEIDNTARLVDSFTRAEFQI